MNVETKKTIFAVTCTFCGFALANVRSEMVGDGNYTHPQMLFAWLIFGLGATNAVGMLLWRSAGRKANDPDPLSPPDATITTTVTATKPPADSPLQKTGGTAQSISANDK